MSSGDEFSGHLRVRVNALIIRDDEILLIRIASPTRSKSFWMPPGGGVRFGERLHHALVREVREETGLEVDPVHIRYVTEYIDDRFHAVEFYYSCNVTSGNVQMGTDPELDAGSQIICDIKWIGLDQLKTMEIYPEFLKTEPRDMISEMKGETRFIAGPAF